MVFEKVDFYYDGVWIDITLKFDSLYREFMDWFYKNNIYPIVTLTSGAGYFKGFCKVEDAEKIKAWFEENSKTTTNYYHV